MPFDRKAYMKEYHKKHYQDNKDLYKKRAKEWVENNIDKRRAVAKERYAQYRGYPSCECCDRKDIRDFYMRCPKGYHVDHIKTKSKGGKHCVKNLQYLSPEAHGTKSANERWGNE